MGRYLIILLVGVMLCGVPVMAKDLVGIFSSWASFRDVESDRCYAIAQPKEVVGRDSEKGNASFSIGFWPKKSVQYQVFVRFSRERSSNSIVTLSAGGRRFRLKGNRSEAWGKDRRMNIAIIAAMRGAASLSIESIGRDGRPIVDAYALKGASSAIDSAALSCLKN